MKKDPELKKIPRMYTDEEAEHFLETVDLSEYDLSQFKPIDLKTMEFAPKTDRITMRLPSHLLSAVKASAAKQKIPYQRYIRQLIEAGLR